MFHQALTGGVNIVDRVSQMPEVAAAGIFFRVPIVRQFHLGVFIARRRQKHQRVAALGVVLARQFSKAERVAIEAQRLLNVRYPDHGMQVFHGISSRFARIWSKQCRKANSPHSSSIFEPITLEPLAEESSDSPSVVFVTN